MLALGRIVVTLQRIAAIPAARGPIVVIMDGNGELDVRVPPPTVMRSSASFFSLVRAGLRETDARAMGVVLPVRTIWGEECVCDYLDAEALALVAVEDVSGRIASVGLHCPIHALPSGWREAHDRLRSIAEPLRLLVADRPLEEYEAI